MKYLKHGNAWSLTPDSKMDVRDSLPPGNYTFCRNPMTGEYFLEESEPFVIPTKLYGKTVQWSDRILSTFRTETNQVGVLLSGVKGSGKTLLSKYVSFASGLPVLIVNSPFSDERFMRTVQGITQRAVILFDEFEKLYDREAQEKILTLFDGVYTATNKIMILTCNDRHSVREYFHNRPGRLRYSIEFGSLSAEFIEEYCLDNLKEHSLLGEILKLSVSCDEFNFDMLQALVKELNTYGGTVEEAVEILNVKPISRTKEIWDVTLSAYDTPGLVVSTTETLSVNLVTWFNMNGERRAYDFDIRAEGTLPGGKKADPDAENSTDVFPKHLKHVDPYTHTYVLEFDAYIDPEGEEEEPILVPIRMVVKMRTHTSVLSTKWGVTNQTGF